MTEELNDNNNAIRQNAEQLLKRVEKREQLLSSLSPNQNNKQLLTPQQQCELYQQSIQRDKTERRNAEKSLRHHGYVPKVERRRVVLDGKVYYLEEEVDNDSDGDCSFVSCVEEEKAVHVEQHRHESSLARKSSKDEWVHLASSTENQLNDEVDGDWEPLVSNGGVVSDSSHDVHVHSSNEATEDLTRSQSNSSTDSTRDIEASTNRSDAECQDVMQSNNTAEIAIHKEKDTDDNNPLLWIGGGIAFVGAVAGLAFANAKKKEHYEKKSGRKSIR